MTTPCSNLKGPILQNVAEAVKQEKKEKKQMTVATRRKQSLTSMLKNRLSSKWSNRFRKDHSVAAKSDVESVNKSVCSGRSGFDQLHANLNRSHTSNTP